MKLILITTPTFFTEEDQILTALFEEGLEVLHLRKPGADPLYAERLLSLIPSLYHKRIVIHDHFYLAKEFGLMGIHLNHRSPEIPEGYQGHISCSCHSIDDVRRRKGPCDYVFLSPIFDSISKNNYSSAYSRTQLLQAAKAGIIDRKVIALGGINASPSPYARAENRGHKRGGEESLRPAIVARGLTKCFGSFTAARDISFSVRPGEICGLLGPNGAGKSTTFRMLCGLLKPTSGSCEVAGIDLLSSSSAARANMGYMAQKFSLYPDIPVAANIRLFADLYGLDKVTRTQRTQLLAEALGLEDHLSSITETLPLGLKQRLALLCATLHNPAVLFLDEPTSGVDVRTRRDFWKHILAMTETGTAVLVTTHCMDEAEYCDTICLIYQGAMIHYGTPEALKRECCGEARGLDPTLEDPTLEDAFIAAIQRWHADHEE